MNIIEKLIRIKAECKRLLEMAACSGPAEAGWRVTIDRIDEITPFVEQCVVRGIDGAWIWDANKIIDAWDCLV